MKEKGKIHVYSSPSERARKTARKVMKTMAYDYKERIRSCLFLKITDPASSDFLSLLKNNRRSGIPEEKFVTDFLKGKWAYYDKDKGILGHPINLAKPYLYDMKRIFDRVSRSNSNRISTFIYFRHGDKTGINGDLSELGMKQAENLGKTLRSDLKEMEENSDSYDNPIYIAGHNTFFESVVASLFFGKRNKNGLDLHDKSILDSWLTVIPTNSKDIFSDFNDEEYKNLLQSGDEEKIEQRKKELLDLKKEYKKLDFDEYLAEDWQKMLEFTEQIKFIFYPPKNGEESYMEIQWRGKTEKITKTEFDKIVLSLGKEEKNDLENNDLENNDKLKLSSYKYNIQSSEESSFEPIEDKENEEGNSKLVKDGFVNEKGAGRNINDMKKIDCVIRDMEDKGIIGVSEKEGGLYCTIRLPGYKEVHWFEPNLKENSDNEYKGVCSYLFGGNAIIKTEVKLSGMIGKDLAKRKNEKLANYLKEKEKEGLIFEGENGDQRLKFINLFGDYLDKHYNLKLDDLGKENAFFRAIHSIGLFHSNCGKGESRNIIQCDEEGCYIFNSECPSLLGSILLTDCNI